MRAIDADNLSKHKFVGVEGMQIITGRRNGKTLLEQTVNNAYKIGWNHAIEALVENEPAIDTIVKCKDCKHQKKYWHEDKRMKEKGYWIYGCDFVDDPFVGTPVLGADNQFCSSAEAKKNEKA